MHTTQRELLPEQYSATNVLVYPPLFQYGDKALVQRSTHAYAKNMHTGCLKSRCSGDTNYNKSKPRQAAKVQTLCLASGR